VKKEGDMEKNIRVWFHKEADFLEVMFAVKEGYFKETGNEDVMEKVDADGKVIGFSILHVSQHEKSPISFDIKTGVA
jgi:uncharacterized protein YuzE